MEEVLEHYGLGLLGIISLVLVLEIFFNCYSSGGVISQVVEKYLITLCGVM